MGKFADWMLLREAKKPQPVQMPKGDSPVVKFEEPKERKRSGRRDTSFRDEGRKGTRGDKNRRAIDLSQD